jgi:hypothetical protein
MRNVLRNMVLGALAPVFLYSLICLFDLPKPFLTKNDQKKIETELTQLGYSIQQSPAGSYTVTHPERRQQQISLFTMGAGLVELTGCAPPAGERRSLTYWREAVAYFAAHLIRIAILQLAGYVRVRPGQLAFLSNFKGSHAHEFRAVGSCFDSDQSNIRHRTA